MVKAWQPLTGVPVIYIMFVLCGILMSEGWTKKKHAQKVILKPLFLVGDMNFYSVN